MIPQLPPPEFNRWRADAERAAPVVLDVREPWEIAICHIEGSVCMPLGQLASRIEELPRERPIVCVCHHGARSQHAATLLANAGFAHVYNLRGGIAAWTDEVDPAMPRY